MDFHQGNDLIRSELEKSYPLQVSGAGQPGYGNNRFRNHSGLQGRREFPVGEKLARLDESSWVEGEGERAN